MLEQLSAELIKSVTEIMADFTKLIQVLTVNHREQMKEQARPNQKQLNEQETGHKEQIDEQARHSRDKRRNMWNKWLF